MSKTLDEYAAAGKYMCMVKVKQRIEDPDTTCRKKSVAWCPKRGAVCHEHNLQEKCEWCGDEKDLPEPVPFEKWSYIKATLPKGWKRIGNPIGKETIDVCTGCNKIIEVAKKEASKQAEKLKLKMLIDAKPRGPRVESDLAMRKKERERAAEGL